MRHQIRQPRSIHRTLFLSDLHLGALGCKADRLLDFLTDNPADHYLLVGDVLDLWHPLLPYWTAADQAVIDHLAARRAAGAKITYLTGNHDPDPAAALATRGLAVATCRQIVHCAGDGRRFLVVHGDICDARFFRAHVLTRLGSRVDHLLRRMDRALTRLRRRSSPEARSTIEAALASVNMLMHRGRAHERRVIGLARDMGLDGAICGHFHIAGLHDDHGLTYANCGDWVDSLTAIAEDERGQLSLLAADPQPVAQGQGARPDALARA
ncbi:UDP-2,3-diacylglucosamine diphosphatase [Paracoccus sp. p4-l81]|uniref:UDP-2,3-diacylglucosamine diphosphatase n=1 Tax=Paracoccus sp. p4-l81 TaxID=3342806 RepID=UPI0035BB653B